MRTETSNLPLNEMIEVVNDKSGLLTFYKTEREGQDRIENLNELVNAATSFVGEEGYGLDASAAQIDVEMAAAVPLQAGQVAPVVEPLSPLDAFLSHASLEAGDNQASAGQDALQLMTVHSAKGLEFDAVFITGLEEGLFPHDNSAEEDDGLEEERRLMYVAITRARQRLYLSFAQSRMLHGQTRYNMRSRFFAELPEDGLKWLTPRQGNSYPMRGGSRYYEEAARVEPIPGWAHVKRAEASGFRIGQSVVHAKFGEGVIVNLEGAGSDARAHINFGRNGLKWLALGIAKLEPA
jgi:DNA helicase-2/ATP-dependent DNA helicase PcrA